MTEMTGSGLLYTCDTGASDSPWWCLWGCKGVDSTVAGWNEKEGEDMVGMIRELGSSKSLSVSMLSAPKPAI